MQRLIPIIFLSALAAVAQGGEGVDEKLPSGAIARLGNTQLRAGGSVEELVYSPDGKYLAAGTVTTRGICVWDAKTGRRILNVSIGGLRSDTFFTEDGSKLVFVADKAHLWRCDDWTASTEAPLRGEPRYGKIARLRGKRYYTGRAADGTIALFEADGNKQLFTAPRFTFNQSPRVSPDDRYLLIPSSDESRTNHGIHVWDIASQKKAYELMGYSSVVGRIEVSPDGRYLLAAASGDPLRLWDLTTGKQAAVLSDEHSYAAMIAFSPAGDRAAVSTRSGTLQDGAIYEIPSGKRLFALHTAADAAAFSPDGKQIAIAAGTQVYLLDAATGERILPAQPPPPETTSQLREIHFSPDGETIATVGINSLVTLWDRRGAIKGVVGQDERWKSPGQVGKVYFSSDGKSLLLQRGGSTIQQWDVAGRKLVNELPTAGSTLWGSAMSSNGQAVALAGPSGSIELHVVHDPRLRPPVQSRRLVGHRKMVKALALSAEGKLLASAADRSVIIWDVAGGKPEHELEVAADVVDMEVSSDGSGLAVATQGGVEIFSLATGRLAQRLDQRHLTCLAISPNAATIATGDQLGGIALWNAESGERLAAWKGHKSRIRHISFRSDGKCLGSGSDDQTAKLWNVDDQNELRILDDFASPIMATLFGPGESWFAAAEATGRAVAYDATTGKQLMESTRCRDGVLAMGAGFHGKQLFVLDGQPMRIAENLPHADEETPLNLSIPLTPNVGSTTLDFVTMPHAQQIAAIYKHSIELWDVQKGARSLMIPTPSSLSSSGRLIAPASPSVSLRLLAASNDGRYLSTVASPGYGGIDVWDVIGQRRVARISSDETRLVWTLAFSPAEPLLVAASSKGVRMWEIPSGRLLRSIEQKVQHTQHVPISRDGGLFVLRADNRIQLHEVHTGQVCFETPESETSISCLSLAPDAKSVAAGCTDGTAVVWSLRPADYERAEKEHAAEGLDQYWDALAADDARAAYHAAWSLVDAGDRAVAYLAERLHPADVPEVNSKRVRELIEQLADTDPMTSRRAASELRKVGKLADSALREALEGDLPAAAKTRVKLLLAAAPPEASSEKYRPLRAIRVLALIESPAARDLLSKLATGDAEHPQTCAAAAILQSRADSPPPAHEAETPKKFSVRSKQFEDFDSPRANWRVNFSTKGKPARKVLERIAKQVDLKLEVGADLADHLAAGVAVEYRGQGCLAAIEAICGQTGVHPVYPSVESSADDEAPPRTVRLAPGKRKLPVALTGPILLEVQRVETQPPLGTGSLRLVARGYGLPRETVDSLGMSGLFPFQIDGIQGTDGVDHLDRMQRTADRRTTTPTGFEEQHDIPLKNLLRDTTALSSVRVSLRLLVPSKASEFSFEPVEVGTLGTAEGVSVLVDSVTQAQAGPNGVTVKFALAGVAGRLVDTEAFDKDGKSIGLSRNGARLLAAAVPAKAIVTLTDLKLHEMSARLDDTPLADADRQPKRLPSIEVEGGESPVSAELLEADHTPDRTRFRVKIHNHTDVSVRLVRVSLVNRQQTKDKTFTEFIFTGRLERPSGWMGILLGAQKDLELTKNRTKFRRPPANLVAVVTEVCFVDGRVWSPKSGVVTPVA